MFNLENSISEWRSQMLAARIPRTGIDELESHLREEITALIAAGASGPDAFSAAIRRLGSPATLTKEFKKVTSSKWLPSLGWAGWILFVISFFLPAYTNSFGWQCAGLSATALTWPDFTFSWSNWSTILLFLTTPANVTLLISPFLVSKLSRRPVALKCLRAANLTAFALVWTYFVLLLTEGARSDLRIGCYFWAISFLMFSLSLFPVHRREKRYA